jgi:uncharacterized iron-regulated protein
MTPAALLVASLLAVAQGWPALEPGLYDGLAGRAASLDEVAFRVLPGSVVIVTEQHDIRLHHANQLEVLRALGRVGLRASVGMEFLAYPDQPWVDRFVRGEIQEPEFLRGVGWQGYPFEWYRPLVLFPGVAGGQVRALNAPARLTRALAQRGLDGLTAEERGLLPPDFQVGSRPYFERFAAVMGQHGPPSEAALRNYFAAQSAWDDTMAWQAAEFIRAYPDQVLVIIVGDFHASYGGGLPDRLLARGLGYPLVISQVNRHGLTDEETRRLVAPHPVFGPRADYVWLTQDTPQSQPTHPARDAHSATASRSPDPARAPHARTRGTGPRSARWAARS